MMKGTAKCSRRRRAWPAVLWLAAAAPAWPQEPPVTARVELLRDKPREKVTQAPDVVVWLTPLGSHAAVGDDTPPERSSYRLQQKHKSFQPHLLVVPVGTAIDFPNLDPYFHNVFSLFEGRRFDLGLYEAGGSRKVRFDREGISYLFCNIHPEMSAVVIALKTPYYGVSNRAGFVSILGVPPGRFRMEVWYERALPEALKRLSREVTITATSRSLGTIDVPESTNLNLSHKNKYGQEYPPVSPDNPLYTRP
jgi:plastocyanin